MSVLTSWRRHPDLAKKIGIVIGLLAVYRLGASLPAPGVNYTAVRTCAATASDSSLYAIVDMLSGGALLQVSLFALGVMPYITASIIIQLLGVVVPRLDALRRDGETGRAVLTQYTRYLTVALATLQGAGLLALASQPGQLFPGCSESLLRADTPAALGVLLVAVVAGAIVLMWFGELITSRGVGNGMSLLIMVSIIADIPRQFAALWTSRGPLIVATVSVVIVAVIVGVVYVEQGQRRIPIQYSNGAASPGRRSITGVARSYLPLKVNMAGVVPVIFAASLMYLPTLAVTVTGSQAGWAQWVSSHLADGTQPAYIAAYAALIVFFSFFYVAITFNPVEVADDLAKGGGFIPGYRPGEATARYLDYVLTRLGTAGAAYLAVIAVVPVVAFAAAGAGAGFLFGGTSLLIVVGVSLDMIKQIRAQISQRSYAGFLRYSTF